MFKTIEDGKLPVRGSKYSACVDLFAREDIVMAAGETKLVPLGVCIDMQQLKENYYAWLGKENLTALHKNPDFLSARWEKVLNSHYLQLMPRSSLALKTGLIMPSVGIIDMDYEGEIGIVLHNPIDDKLLLQMYRGHALSNYETKTIKKGDRIAQITLLEHKSYLFGIDTEQKREGGFGSTN